MSKTDAIVTAAVTARTVADVDRLEAAIRGRLANPRIRFLGDREANWSEVSSPADPAAVLLERVTNQWDSVLELEALRKNRFDWRSPAEAAAELFGIRDGVGNLDPARRDEIARLAIMSLYDSDDPIRRPTIGFRDYGIGLSPEETPTTILSLVRSNKLRKFYLHGVFGKGGSSASVFSDATIIVTRKQPELLGPGEPDRITVAVVREDDAPDVGLPFYRYWVGEDNLPFWVPAADANFEPGTIVLHVNYQAGKMGLQKWDFEESVYAYAETVLFKPTLPYSLQDARTGSANTRPADRRKPSSLSGLAQRLERTREGLVSQSGWSTVPVPDVGDVRLRWWLFETQDHRRKRAAKGYVVLFTTNGQVHHVWDQTQLQYQVEGLRRVSQRLIVEVDCDGIDQKKRVKVFDSFRTQVRKGPEGRALEAAVADALASDQDLQEHESELVRQSLRASTQRISAAFRERLNRAIRAKVPGLSGLTKPGRGGKRPPKPKQETELYSEPTTFSGPETVTLLVGARASLYLEANAVDGFVPDRGTIAVQPEAGAPTLAFGVGDLRRGRLRIGVFVPEDAEPGAYKLDVLLEWVRSSGGLGRIVWTVKADVVTELPEKRPSGTRTGTKKSRGGDIAFVWSKPEDQEGWTPDTVGDLQDLKGSDLAEKMPDEYGDLKDVADTIPTIVLNDQFPDWATYRNRVARQLTDRGVDLRREKYGLAVGVAVANLHLGQRKLRKKHDEWRGKANGNGEPEAPMTPQQLHRATVETARAVLALMPDFDELLKELDEARVSD